MTFDDAYYDNHLFISGEIHEVSTSPLIDVKTFQDLHKKQGVKIYLAEMDIAQAYFLNLYLWDSTQLGLGRILENWNIWIGQHSKKYREAKWDELKSYNKSLDESDKFVVYGLDKMYGFGLLSLLLKEVIPSSDSLVIPEDREGLESWIDKHISNIIDTETFSSSDSTLLRNIEFNIKNPDSREYRDAFMFENFKRYFEVNDWVTQKMYGCFVLFHALQGSDRSLAGKIEKSELVKDKFVSLVSIYADSYLTVPSDVLPSFLAGDGKYSKLKLSYDNIFLAYIKGIEDFKRASSENSINLFKLDGMDSPYETSGRGGQNFSLIPLWGNIPVDKRKVTTDYVQYVYFIDGADWMDPN